MGERGPYSVPETLNTQVITRMRHAPETPQHRPHEHHAADFYTDIPGAGYRSTNLSDNPQHRARAAYSSHGSRSRAITPQTRICAHPTHETPIIHDADEIQRQIQIQNMTQVKPDEHLKRALPNAVCACPIGEHASHALASARPRTRMSPVMHTATKRPNRRMNASVGTNRAARRGPPRDAPTCRARGAARVTATASTHPPQQRCRRAVHTWRSTTDCAIDCVRARATAR